MTDDGPRDVSDPYDPFFAIKAKDGRYRELEEHFGNTYYLETAYFFKAVAHSYLEKPEEVLKALGKIRDDFALWTRGGLLKKEALAMQANEVINSRST